MVRTDQGKAQAGTPAKSRSQCGLLRLLAALPVIGLLVGCGPNLYKQWDRHLKQMVDESVAGRPHRLNDVSLLLGAPPDRCEKIDYPHPRIGALWDDRLTLKAVLPGSPADLAGLRPGMKLVSMDGEGFTTSAALMSWSDRNLREGIPVRIETDQGTFSPAPKVPDFQQCYWDVRGGRVEDARAGAGWGRSGGGAWGRGAAYDRFYRATCRFQDGFLVTFTSQWQM